MPQLLEVLLSPQVTAIRESEKLSTVARRLDSARQERARLELAYSRKGETVTEDQLADELADRIVGDLVRDHFAHLKFRQQYRPDARTQVGDLEISVTVRPEESALDRIKLFRAVQRRTREARTFTERAQFYDFEQSLYRLDAEKFQIERVAERVKDRVADLAGTLVARLHVEDAAFHRLRDYEDAIEDLWEISKPRDFDGHQLNTEYLAEDLRVVHGAQRIKRDLVTLSVAKSVKVEYLNSLAAHPAMAVWAPTEGVDENSLTRFERCLESLYDITVRPDQVPLRFTPVDLPPFETAPVEAVVTEAPAAAQPAPEPLAIGPELEAELARPIPRGRTFDDLIQ